MYRMIRSMMPTALALLIAFYIAPSVCHGEAGPGGDTFEVADVKQPPYADAAGKSVLSFYTEAKKNYDHYQEQARRYDTGALTLRILAFCCALASAVVLVLSNKDWSRRVAIVVSILGAAIPAGDQIFHVGDTQRASWRAVVDLSRLNAKCKDEWELDSSIATSSTEIRNKAARELLGKCRGEMEKIVNFEFERTITPVLVPKDNAKSGK